jgi:hypothetical protein
MATSRIATTIGVVVGGLGTIAYLIWRGVATREDQKNDAAHGTSNAPELESHPDDNFIFPEEKARSQ